MTQRRDFLQTSVACAAGLMAPTAFSQAAPWPSKPINYLVAFPAGGTTDILARLVSQKLGPALGTTLVIENKGGAGGSVGSEIAARAPADGHHLLGGTISSHAINVSLYPKLGYDPIKSFTPVYLYGTNPVVLVVAANSPHKTLRDLLTAAKANPGKLSGASAGNGTTSHMAGESFRRMADVDIQHIPYKGGGPALTGLLAGDVQMMIDLTANLLAQVQAGKLRALAVTTRQRVRGLADLPTLEEVGLKGFDLAASDGLYAPAGTPPAVVERINVALQRALSDPEVMERLRGRGAEPVLSTPAEHQAHINREFPMWARLVKETGARVD
jgi:tripartite-type tricarboxylate transporter receptor subunit TctC